jgi:uncharacterized protein (TIGR03435 family)
LGFSWAAAAVLVAAVGAAILWPRADSALFRVVEGTAQTGDTIRTDRGSGAQLSLADGSRIEMRAQSELSLEHADDGLRILLERGGIIVNAAKQRSGHLYVQTKDMTVSVVGTVFMVNAADDGSRVAVIEGEVRVREGRTETTLRPGEQVSTNPAAATRTVKEEIAWSRDADALGAILETFAKGMALSAGPRTPVTDSPGPVNAAFDQAGATAQGQPAAPRPQFEEASLRPCDPDNIPAPPAGARGGGANSFMMTPGRMHALCLTVATLIRTAYGYGPAELDFLNPGGRGRGMNAGGIPYGLGVEDGLRVKGGPDWVRSERYTIDAVADGAADGATMSGPMLRDLLERRFQLKAHIETEQVPAFALTVAPGGLKVKPAEPDSCVSFPPDPTVPRINGVPVGARRPMLADVRRGEKRVCGQLPERNGPNQVFVAGSSTFSVLAQQLASRLGRVRVYDKTGITDPFDWVLEFADDGPAGSAALNPRAAPQSSDVPRGPTIFVALEEQLGLRLEPAQAPRDFIVIDHVERPSPN